MVQNNLIKILCRPGLTTHNLSSRKTYQKLISRSLSTTKWNSSSTPLFISDNTQRLISPPCTQRQHFFSSLTNNDEVINSESPSRYAVVDHSEAYIENMNGRHGKQLALTKLEGIGKDDPPFDPFLNEELTELKLLNGDESDLIGEGSEYEEAEYVDIDNDEEDDDEEDDDNESPYNNDGSLKMKKSRLAELRAGAPAGGVFAVIELAKSQHKVTVDDVLCVNKVKPVETFAIGTVHTIKDVLLMSSSHLTLVGLPKVTGAEVDVMVEEITQDKKVIVFKNRRRKNSKRKNGFRRDITMLRVLDIRFPDKYKDHVHNKGDNDGQKMMTNNV